MAGNKLRALLGKNQILIFPGVYNAFLARQVEEEGFPGVYISGAGLSNSLGVPDNGTLGLQDFLYFGRWIIRAVDIPVICDADTGFTNVEETVSEYIRAGLSGLHLEDQVFPKRCGHLAGKEVISREEMIEKIQRACSVRDLLDPEFLIIARTDAMGADNVDPNRQLQECIERGKLYRKAGADMIFPESLGSREEFAKYRQKVDGYLLANMTEFGNTPFLTAEEFHELGFNLVLFPVSLFRYHVGMTREFLSVLKEYGNQERMVSKMMSRKEINRILDYEP